MTVAVLLGAPGAGKGTQAPVLAETLGVPVLASGELLRAAVAAGTPLGRVADEYMRGGRLVPDETIVSVFLDRLAQADAAGGAILDGFPRTQAQAEALDLALAATGGRVDRALFIEVELNELVRRTADRRICAANGHVYNVTTNPPRVAGRCDEDGSELTQRPDDREETVRARMAGQIQPLMDVVDHYRQAGSLVVIDGAKSIERVAAELLEALRAPRGA